MAKKILASKGNAGQVPADQTDKIIEQTPDRRYFTIIPNLVDDLALSVYAYRLYGHLRRVAGEIGICWASIRTMADATQMSKSQVARAKDELAAAGLITVEDRPGEDGHFPGHNIRIIDIWKRNVEKYAPVPTGDRQNEPIGATCPSPGTGPVPVVGHKKNPLKKNTSDEMDSVQEKDRSAAEEYCRAHRIPLKPGVIAHLYQLVDQYGLQATIGALEMALEHEAVIHKIPYAREILANQDRGNGNGKAKKESDDVKRRQYPESERIQVQIDPANLPVLVSSAQVQAWDAWERLQAVALSHGLDEKIKELQPPEDADWRLIDERVAQLRSVINAARPY